MRTHEKDYVQQVEARRRESVASFIAEQEEFFDLMFENDQSGMICECEGGLVDPITLWPWNQYEVVARREEREEIRREIALKGAA